MLLLTTRPPPHYRQKQMLKNISICFSQNRRYVKELSVMFDLFASFLLPVPLMLLSSGPKGAIIQHYFSFDAAVALPAEMFRSNLNFILSFLSWLSEITSCLRQKENICEKMKTVTTSLRCVQITLFVCDELPVLMS